MFDSIKRWFGEGHIYCKVLCDDGTVARVKTPYIGDPATFDRREFIQQIKDQFWHKTGKTIIDVSNVRFS